MIVTLEGQDLVGELGRYGVRHLRVATPALDTDPLLAEALLSALASHPEPRFREALIPLFLRHPELSSLVQDLTATLEPAAAMVLRHMYTAAVYLQRLWRGTLGLYLSDTALLPDLFGETYFGLPPADACFGEAGLRGLADLFKRITGYDWLDVYEKVMTLFLAQLSVEYDEHKNS